MWRIIDFDCMASERNTAICLTIMLEELKRFGKISLVNQIQARFKELLLANSVLVQRIRSQVDVKLADVINGAALRVDAMDVPAEVKETAKEILNYLAVNKPPRLSREWQMLINKLRSVTSPQALASAAVYLSGLLHCYKFPQVDNELVRVLEKSTSEKKMLGEGGEEVTVREGFDYSIPRRIEACRNKLIQLAKKANCDVDKLLNLYDKLVKEEPKGSSKIIAAAYAYWQACRDVGVQEKEAASIFGVTPQVLRYWKRR